MRWMDVSITLGSGDHRSYLLDDFTTPPPFNFKILSQFLLFSNVGYHFIH